MALDKAGLKAEIISIQQEMKTREKDSMDEFAEKLATAVDNYVKTATVETTITGTCPSGAVTGEGTGTLS